MPRKPKEKEIENEKKDELKTESSKSKKASSSRKSKSIKWNNYVKKRGIHYIFYCFSYYLKLPL